MPPGSARTVSLVIASRGRPDLLARALSAVRAQTASAFEVIVVCDTPVVPETGLRFLSCAEANISKARNLGVEAARGEIVAFLDDDAVPEPDWLERLVEVFDDPAVGVVGGRVLTDHGRRVQWCGGWHDPSGAERAPDRPFPVLARFAPDPDWQAGVMGANCAWRRAALLSIGGFDEAFRYFLDETDAVRRTASLGWHVAVAPLAEVHHSRAPNAVRGTDGLPGDPFELAASRTVFALRHMAPGHDAIAAKRAFERWRTQMADRYARYVDQGRMQPARRDWLLARADAGRMDGARRVSRCPLAPACPDPQPGFVAMPAFAGRRLAIETGLWPSGVARAHRLALDAVRAGHSVMLLRPVPPWAAPVCRYRQGLWHQTVRWPRAPGSLGAAAIAKRRAMQRVSRPGCPISLARPHDGVADMAEPPRIADRMRDDLATDG